MAPHLFILNRKQIKRNIRHIIDYLSIISLTRRELFRIVGQIGRAAGIPAYDQKQVHAGMKEKLK